MRDVGSASRLYKRPFDLAVLVTAHVLLLPVWLLLWALIPLAIKLDDRGPIFYGQKRMGKDARVFTVLKFRTMIPNADRVGPAWTTVGDRRVTRVGRVLRKTALDELPSLLAIWSGSMSFVGPRALAADEHRYLESQIPGFADRLKVRPGLTGLAQVYNLNDEPLPKLKFDREYIEGMSLWLDIKLMLLSVRNTVLARWDARAGKPSDTAAKSG